MEDSGQTTRLHVQADLDEPVISVSSSIVQKPATRDNPVQFVVTTEVSMTIKPSMTGLKPGASNEELARVIAEQEAAIHAAQARHLQQEVNRRYAELMSAVDEDDAPF